jgi:hypothetical protein
MFRHHPNRLNASLCAGCIALVLFALCAPVTAHPLLQGSLQLSVRSDAVAIHARVSAEEVRVTNALTTPGGSSESAKDVSLSAYEQHAAYLAMHLHVIADGQELPGGVLSVSPPDAHSSDSAQHELLYPLLKPGRISRLELRTDVLADEGSSAAARWEATYVVTLIGRDGQISGGMLLTRAAPVVLPLDSTAGIASEAAPSRWTLVQEYFVHGVRHILRGDGAANRVGGHFAGRDVLSHLGAIP